jgi:hypothetical protein
MEIPIINWFEEPIKSSIQSVFSGLNSKIESLDVFNLYKNVHFEILKSQVSVVKILGMQAPMNLKTLYYPANVSTDIRRRIYAPEWETINGASVDSDVKLDINKVDGELSKNLVYKVGAIKVVKSKVGKKLTGITACELGDEYISKTNRVVVLGGPGAGKTTFLKFLALAYSDKDIFSKTKLNTSSFPIYLQLPLLAKDSGSVLDYISSPLVSRTDEYAYVFYARLIESGLCTVLMDSLDEVPVDARKALIQKIKEFSSRYPKAKIVISCRTADYDQVFEDFSEVELTRLTKEAVASIVKAWFGKQSDRAEKLLTLLENDEAVASLTETPLLLSLLCIQFKNDLALPKRKTELYRRCVDALIRDWDTTRGFRRDTSYSQLSDDRKEKIFEAVAGSTCSEYISYEFHESFLLQTISDEIARFSLDPNDAKGILVEIESHHGVVEKCSAEMYEFSHGTMQEYFAAKYFVAKRMEIDVLRKNYENEAWHDVILFMSSMMDDSASVLQFLVDKSSMEKFQNYPAFGRRLAHLLLLYRCMAMGVNVNPSLRSSICSHLVNSQINMLQQINSDGVLPYAARSPNGVRQANFYYKKGRNSLDKVLQPYRILMNQMVLSPIREYSDQVIEAVRKIEIGSGKDMYKNLGLATCLLVPVSEANPSFFLEKMLSYSATLLKPRADSVRQVLLESINTHRVMYPDLFKGELSVF